MDEKKQPLLHVGSKIRDQLETIAQADGGRWQDLARQVLLNFVNMKMLERALPLAQVALSAGSNDETR